LLIYVLSLAHRNADHLPLSIVRHSPLTNHVGVISAMNRRFIPLAAALALSLLMAGAVAAAQIPGTEMPYATYRRKMLENGFKPEPPCKHPPCVGLPYPEMITGNRLGSAHWIHPVDGTKVHLLLWPCKHGWCLAPPVMPPGQ